MLSRALDDIERQELDNRRQKINHSLCAGNPKEIGKSVSQLLAIFPNSRASEDDAKLVVAGYVTALQDLPTRAVELVCQKWMRGECGGSMTFAPSAPELRLAIMKIIWPYKDELQTISQLLDYEHQESPLVPHERERVEVGFRSLREALKLPHGDGQEERKQIQAAQIDKANASIFQRECTAYGIDSSRGASPSLLRTLGRINTPQKKDDAA